MVVSASSIFKGMRAFLVGIWWVSALTALQVYRECQKEGMIAFTYDQGPSQYTGILLTALAKAGVKATFHVVPDYLDNPVLSANLRRAASDGHLIGLFVKDSVTESTVKAYLANATAALKQYVNYQPMFLRFPVPGPSEAMLKIVTGLGYKVTSYNLDSQDYSFINDTTTPNGQGAVFNTVKSILDQIIPPTLGSFICVQRDIVQTSVMQTTAILNYTKSRGYKAVRLDQCLAGADLPLDPTKGDPTPKEDSSAVEKEGMTGQNTNSNKNNGSSRFKVFNFYLKIITFLQIFTLLIL